MKSITYLTSLGFYPPYILWVRAARTLNGVDKRPRHPNEVCYDDRMDEPNLTPPPEASRDPIEIRDEDAITIDEALLIATGNNYPLGKSTLQRWSKFWCDRQGPVKSVLVTHAGGRFYKISREDFQAWLFDQSQNARPHETPQDLSRSQETSRDLG